MTDKEEVAKISNTHGRQMGHKSISMNKGINSSRQRLRHRRSKTRIIIRII